MATATFTAENGKAYSLRALERDLLAYMHGEETDVPPAVIKEALKQEPALAEVWEELQTVAELLEYLPSVQPSRYFVRELMEALPALRAQGRASARLEELVQRTKWTVEDRLAFTVEYWRYRFRNHPVSSSGLAAATLLLVVTLAWLPGMYFLPPGTVPDFPGLSSDPSGPIAEGEREEGGAGPTGGGIIPPPVDEDGWLDESFVEPELVFGESRIEVPQEVLEQTEEEERIDRPEQPEAGVIGPLPRQPFMPDGQLPPPERQVLPWYQGRKQEDDHRRITRPERVMIDRGLRWLAANQHEDGSWGHAASVAELLEAEQAREREETPGLVTPSSHGEDSGEPLGQEEAPLAEPKVVQTTARAVLAFTAENYGSRLSQLEELRPQRSAHSPIPRGRHFDEHVEKMREVVGNAVRFLRTHQHPETGQLVANGPESTIAHAEAFKALAEDYLIGSNPRLISVFPLALEYLQEVRNEDGGWGPQPGHPSSAEATLAVVQALVVYARTPISQLEIRSPLFRHVATFLADNEEQLIYDAAPRSAAAVLALHQILSLPELGLDMAEFSLDPRTSLAVVCESMYRPRWRIDRILGSTPVDFDYWLYASQTLSSVPSPGRRASDIREWRRMLVEALNEQQVTIEPQGVRDPGKVYWPVSPSLRRLPGVGNAWVSASSVLALQNRYRYAWLYSH